MKVFILLVAVFAVVCVNAIEEEGRSTFYYTLIFIMRSDRHLLTAFDVCVKVKSHYLSIAVPLLH